METRDKKLQELIQKFIELNKKIESLESGMTIIMGQLDELCEGNIQDTDITKLNKWQLN